MRINHALPAAQMPVPRVGVDALTIRNLNGRLSFRAQAFVEYCLLASQTEPAVRMLMNSMQLALDPAAALSQPSAYGFQPAAPLQVELIDDLAAAQAVGTAFQRFDWVAAWNRHVAKSDGLRFLILLGSNAGGTPQFLLPLVYRPSSSLVVARFPGKEHSNINMGLWRGDAVAGLTAARLIAALRKAARQRGIDLFMLLQQPVHWHGLTNPLALLPRQPTVDDVWGAPLPAETDTLKAILTKSMRGRIRGKARKLEKLAGYRYLHASTPAEIDRLLAAFFVQKAAHFAERGINNVFADPRVSGFIRTGCHATSACGRPVIELHGIVCDDEVIAVIGGVADAWRFSCMFNSYTTSEAGRHSPGLILLSLIVPRCAARGLAGFDLGPGRAPYKSVFCREAEGLFDSVIAVSWRGRLAAPALRALRAGKRHIKANTAWRNLGPALRRHLVGHAASGLGGACDASASTTRSE
jgi:CelD/BcsL family acetyltransferase involved in cellulose biosynthesis